MLNSLIIIVSHAGFIRYLKNTSWMMGEQLLRIIASLFVGIWVARYLGPEQFGLFSYVLAFTAIFGGIAKLGLDNILVREFVNRPEKRNTYLGTAFWLKFLGAFIVMGILATIAPFTGNNSTTNLFIFIIATGMLLQSFEVVEFYLQSQVLAKIVSICKIVQLLLSSIIKIYLVLTEASLIYFVLVTVFDAFTLAISYAIAYKLTKQPSFYQHFNPRIAKQLIKDSWPLTVSTIFVLLYLRIDQVMIKEMLGEYDVGIYSAAAKLSEAFYFIPMIITGSLFPAILAAKKKNVELYNNRLQRLYTLMVWSAIFIAVAIYFSASWLVSKFFGVEYEGAETVLTINVWAGIFVFLGVASGKWFISENYKFLLLQRTLLGLAINVILNLFLIPRYGIQGAAYATLACQSFTALFFDAFDTRTRQMFKQKVLAFLIRVN